MPNKLNLRQKLLAIYEELDHVEKAGKNTKQNYNFVRAADVLREVRKVFAKYGIWAQPNYEQLGTYDIKTNSGGNMHTSMVRVEIVLFDADSDETKVISGLGDGADSGDKGVYKAQTGATKNALRNALLLPDEADPEADEDVDERTEYKPAKKNSYNTNTGIGVIEPIVDYVESSTEQWKSTAEFIDKTLVSVPLAEPNTAVEVSMPINDGVVPNEAELDKYRTVFSELTKDLSDSGALKASRGMSAAKKVLVYLLQTTGAQKVEQISTTQWRSVVEFIDKMKAADGGLVELGQLINKASHAANKESTNA